MLKSNIRQLNSIPARPFLKWVGGKRLLLPELLKRMPWKYDTYHELFLGGGALCYAAKPKKAVLSDVNERLITTYAAVRDEVKSVIKYLTIHERMHSRDYFIRARTKLSTETNPVKLGALFIYLNKTCFNGIYSVTRANDFNTSLGGEVGKIVDSKNLLKCSLFLKKYDIQHRSFEETRVHKNAFYYLDPPYHLTMDRYTPDGFGSGGQKSLASFCHKIDEKGSLFMQSNSDTALIRDLYKKYRIETVTTSCTISAKVEGRGTRSELIIRNY